MNSDSPITPPPELVKQWIQGWYDDEAPHVATQAARWGADQELEACCEWLLKVGKSFDSSELRAARRPKPPSLKESALTALEQVDEWAVANMSHLAIHDDLVAGVDTIRRALESLPD